MERLALILAMMACISLVTSPATAADYTLGIFGNANMDDTIDEKDGSSLFPVGNLMISILVS
ncbi:MAG TPA: hypothetical protein P5045_08325 [Methanothrix sp.]|nr:hypothetical protein [Methanothrix sp.]HRS85767.1 hypothetical protein [Methanothrix sp.]